MNVIPSWILQPQKLMQNEANCMIFKITADLVQDASCHATYFDSRAFIYSCVLQPVQRKGLIYKRTSL